MFSWLEIVDSKRFWTAPNWPLEASTEAMNLSILSKVVWAEAAVETENDLIPSWTIKAADPTLLLLEIPSIENPADKDNEIVSLAFAPTWNVTLPSVPTKPFPAPAKTFCPANVVLHEILVISEQSWSTWLWIACL